MFLASAEPRKETLVGSALLEDTAVPVVKGIKSFSISLHGSSEPQTDQTSNPRVEEKTLPLPSLHSSSVTGTDIRGLGVEGGFPSVLPARPRHSLPTSGGISVQVGLSLYIPAPSCHDGLALVGGRG